MNYDTCDWDYIKFVRNPYIGTLQSFTEDTILFDGYFNVEGAVMPVERIMNTPSGSYHVEIMSKTILEDTSVYEDAEDDLPGCKICFFPTAITELKYRILLIITNKEEREQIRELIRELEFNIRRRQDMLD